MALDWKLGNNSFAATENGSDIYNLLRNSIMVDKGTFPFKPNFGSELYKLRREKKTERTRLLAIQYCTEATNWLLQTGKATEIEISSQYSIFDNNRLDLKIEAKQASGETVTFETFVRVV